MGGSTVTETEPIKQQNIDTYAKALDYMIQKMDDKGIGFIAGRLIPKKQGNTYTILVDDCKRGYGRNIKSFTVR